MTSYQHERYIARALDGVLAQRGVEFELLVGDDASTDGTRAVIAEYARAHPDVIRTFFPERNLGQGGKPIFGELIERARGRLPRDARRRRLLDRPPTSCGARSPYLDEHPECSMCFHNVLCVYEDEDASGRAATTAPDQPREVDVAALLERCVVGRRARRSSGARRSLRCRAWYFELPWGDWPLYFMAAEHGALRYLPEVMGVYRIHGGRACTAACRGWRRSRPTAFYEGCRAARAMSATAAASSRRPGSSGPSSTTGWASALAARALPRRGSRRVSPSADAQGAGRRAAAGGAIGRKPAGPVRG